MSEYNRENYVHNYKNNGYTFNKWGLCIGGSL